MGKYDNVNSAFQVGRIAEEEAKAKLEEEKFKNQQLQEQRRQTEILDQINNKLESSEIEKNSFDFFYEKFIKFSKDDFKEYITSNEIGKLDFLINRHRLIECVNKSQLDYLNSNILKSTILLAEVNLRITDKGKKFRKYVSDHQMKNELLEAYKSFSKNETNLPVNSKLIFIGMSYDESLAERQEMIEEAIKEMNFKPTLAKTEVKPSNFTIDEKMIELMNKSKYGIFDISLVKDNYPNIGAIYECGYMDGAGKEIIMICKSTDIKKLHFDLRNKDILSFDTEQDLKTELKSRIKKLWINKGN